MMARHSSILLLSSWYALSFLLGYTLAAKPPDTCRNLDADTCIVLSKEQECFDEQVLVQHHHEKKKNDNSTLWGEAQLIDKVPKQYQQATQQVIQATHDYMTKVVHASHEYNIVKEKCRNHYKECAYWAALGECLDNIKFMQLQCAPSCQTCMQLDIKTRCPINESIPSALPQRGDLNRLFQRIVNEHKENVTVYSMPDAHDDNTNDNIINGPWIISLRHFLSHDECQTLIRLGHEQTKGYQPSLGHDLTRTGDTDAVLDEGRTSTNAWCQSNCSTTIRPLEERISQVVQIPVEHEEWWQLLRYQEGQFYKTHHDYISQHMDRPPGVRMLTVLLYLNDDFGGGETYFSRYDLKISPQEGMALIWPNVKNKDTSYADYRTEHEALPVVGKGVKYAANAWIHERNFRQAFAEGCAV